MNTLSVRLLISDFRGVKIVKYIITIFIIVVITVIKAWSALR